MSQVEEGKIYYFAKKGPVNTDRALDIALTSCKKRAILCMPA